MPGQWQRRAGAASMIFLLLFAPLLRPNETEKGANMKKTIQLDEQTTRLIDEARGTLSRSEYIDRLLKKHQGVTLPHTPKVDCQKRKPK